MSGAICKGDWAIGTACGRCSRCQDGLPGELQRLGKEVRELVAAVSRLKVQLAPAPKLTITIEGAQGAGKTTMMRHVFEALKERLGEEVITEDEGERRGPIGAPILIRTQVR